MEDRNQNNTNPADSSDADNIVASDGNTELEACKKQAEEYLNNWKRERADFINYKKDEVKRIGEFIKFGNESLMLELLDIMDDFYLAAKQLRDNGLDQVVKKFENLLGKYEVEKIKIDGEKFDPLKHEAVESEEGGEKLEEVRAGYTMHGRVIRPARVKIIK